MGDHHYWATQHVHEIMSPDTITESELGDRIRDATDRGIARQRRYTAPHARFTVSPSETTHCLRQAIILRHYPALPAVWPEDKNRIRNDAGMLRMAAAGNVYDDQAIEALVSQGIAIIGELRIEDPEMKSSMRLDGWYEATDGEDNWILEVKSTNMMKFKSLIEEMDCRDKDLLQLIFYMDVMEVQLGLMMYVDRGTGKMEVMTVKYDEAIADYMLERMQAVLDSDETHEVISRPYNITRYWMCTKANCVVRAICKALPEDGGKMDCGGAS